MKINKLKIIEYFYFVIGSIFLILLAFKYWESYEAMILCFLMFAYCMIMSDLQQIKRYIKKSNGN